MILAVDRLRSEWARLAVGEYLERIGRYVPVERHEVRPARGDAPHGREEEGERLLARVRGVSAGHSADRLVALAPEGRSMDSPEWAWMIDEAASSGTARIVFAVGGATGLARDVLDTATDVIGLGRHTLSHELAQVVLAEQIYRAWTILRNEPYHR